MTPLMLEVGLPVFLATIVAVLAVWRLAVPTRSAVDARLQALGQPHTDVAGDGRNRLNEAWADWAEQGRDRWGQRGSTLERNLRQAGMRSESAVLVYRLTQFVVVIAGLGLAGMWYLQMRPTAEMAIVTTCLWGFVLFLLPGVIVRWRATERQRAIVEGLPGALDLVVVCLEAGLGLDAAIVRVAAEISGGNPVLGGELLMVSREVQAGVPRREALKNLSERTGVQEIASLTAILAQSERLGTSVSQALRAQAGTSRVKRQQHIEEEAAKAAVKIVFPLAFCIFPAMFVVILGPALLGVVRLFLKLN